MLKSGCFWCKVAIAALCAAAGIAIGGAILSGPIGGLIGSIVAYFGIALEAAAIASLALFAAKVLGAILAAGFGLATFANWLCCKLGWVECCNEGSVTYWMRYGEIYDATAPNDEGKVVFATKDCQELKRLIEKLRKDKKIDDAEEQKLKNQLKDVCPE